MLPRSIKKALNHLPEWLMLRFGRRFNVQGIKLVVFVRDRGKVSLIRGKITDALCLVQHHSPKNYSRVQSFTPNILIFDAYGNRGIYISDLKLCQVSTDYALLEKTTPLHLASVLVHEATHGFLDSRRITYEEPHRVRIERICIKEQMAFARRSPEAGDLLTEAQSLLSIAPEFWKDEAFFERGVEELKKMGAPKWLVNLVVNKRKKVKKKADFNKPPDHASS
jgi:hypothetical protein